MREHSTGTGAQGLLLGQAIYLLLCLPSSCFIRVIATTKDSFTENSLRIGTAKHAEAAAQKSQKSQLLSKGNTAMNMQEEDSNAGSDIGHEDLADVASFDADADVLPDNSNRKVPSPKHSKGASSATTRQSRIQEVTSHRSTAQAAHEPRQKSKLRNSLRSSIKSTGSKAKNQADELRKGAMVNRASVSRNRKMSEKRQDSFISATRILERTASDLQMVRDELQHQKKKVSLTMVKEEIVMDFLTLNFSNEKLEISYRRKVRVISPPFPVFNQVHFPNSFAFHRAMP